VIPSVLSGTYSPGPTIDSSRGRRGYVSRVDGRKEVNKEPTFVATVSTFLGYLGPLTTGVVGGDDASVGSACESKDMVGWKGVYRWNGAAAGQVLASKAAEPMRSRGPGGKPARITLDPAKAGSMIG